MLLRSVTVIIASLGASKITDKIRYYATIHMDTRHNTARLTFSEIIHQYRRTNLFHLEFTPTPWHDVVKGVKDDIDRIVEHHSKLKSALVQVLELVSKHQPSILLTSGWSKQGPASQSGKWQDLMDTLLPSSVEGCVKNGVMTVEDQMERKKMFVELTNENNTSLEGRDPFSPDLFVCS